MQRVSGKRRLIRANHSHHAVNIVNAGGSFFSFCRILQHGLGRKFANKIKLDGQLKHDQTVKVTNTTCVLSRHVSMCSFVPFFLYLLQQHCWLHQELKASLCLSIPVHPFGSKLSRAFILHLISICLRSLYLALSLRL